ncbi:MAG: hypothetical protein AABY22_34455 [Nanoarchaeota archaeon]
MIDNGCIFPIENSVSMGEPPPLRHCEKCNDEGMIDVTRQQMYDWIRREVCDDPNLTDTEKEWLAKETITEWRFSGTIPCSCQNEIA